jgi:hypothetical protein
MTAVAFRRPAYREFFELAHGFAFGGDLQALFFALFGFAVEGLCDRGWAADFTQQQDFYMKFASRARDSQHVADADGSGGFGGLSGGLNSAEFTGFGCEGSRLEEAGGPEPFVDSYRVAQIIFLPVPVLPRR